VTSFKYSAGNKKGYQVSNIGDEKKLSVCEVGDCIILSFGDYCYCGILLEVGEYIVIQYTDGSIETNEVDYIGTIITEKYFLMLERRYKSIKEVPYKIYDAVK